MFHELTIIGTVGREPDMRYTADGKASCSFSVAANRKLPNNVTETVWFKVTTWDKTAEYINNNVHKGFKVLVVGRLACSAEGGPRIYTKNDGTPAAAFEVVAEKFRIVEWGNTNKDTQVQAQAHQQYQQRPQQAQQPQKQAVQQTQSTYQEDIPW